MPVISFNFISFLWPYTFCDHLHPWLLWNHQLHPDPVIFKKQFQLYLKSNICTFKFTLQLFFFWPCTVLCWNWLQAWLLIDTNKHHSQLSKIEVVWDHKNLTNIKNTILDPKLLYLRSYAASFFYACVLRILLPFIFHISLELVMCCTNFFKELWKNI